jgi:hypothetical protein
MSSQSRIFKFFASPRGRRTTFFSAVGAAVASFSVNFFPHTFLIDKYREFVAIYKDGIERPISDSLKERFKIAQEHLKVTDFERSWMEPFVVAGFDTYHIGSTKFRYGALVGIPVNYTYTSANEIDKSSIIVRGKPVDWNSPGGLLLQEALVLADDEKIFGITREMCQLMNNKVYFNSFIGTGAIASYYVFTNTINNRLKLFYRPLSMRVFFYSIMGFFMYGLYCFVQDYTQVSYFNSIVKFYH